jgi:phosphopantothenoylcysteine decarboxylase/phosphopantothenate--cysteine ligase
MAAAVADFRPSSPFDEKIGKGGREGLVVEMEPTSDVLASLSAARRPGQTLVGFAAEHGKGGAERARAKLERKGLDAVVLNDISDPEIGFDSERNEVTIITAGASLAVPRGSKEAVAAVILDQVQELRNRSDERAHT